MKALYSKVWAKTDPVGRAITLMFGWPRANVRVPGFWNGAYTPIPKGRRGGDAEDFRVLCEARASELWGSYQEVAVLCSGGADSTLVACSMLRARPAGYKLIITADKATLEHPEYDIMRYFSEQGCEFMESTEENVKALTARGGMMLTGYHGDTILCGDIIRYLDAYETIWDMTEVEVLTAYGVTQGLHEDTCAQMLVDLEPLLALNPLERTAANSAWWVDFVSTWDQDETSPMIMFNTGPAGKGFINFYNTEGFQLWSIQPVENKVGKTALTHKRVYKDIIASIVGFEPAIPVGTHNNDDDELFLGLDVNRALAVMEDGSVILAPISLY